MPTRVQVVRAARAPPQHAIDVTYFSKHSGPLGPGGVEIRNCGASGADSTYCQDACGGYEGELDGVDNYKYRYYITGKVGDLESLPSNPKPDDAALYFPYTLRCHRGVTVDEYKSSLPDGFTSAHKATEHLGYSSKINPVKCLDGQEKTDYDWLALKDTTEAVCDFNGAAAAAPTVAGLAIAAAGLVAML